MGGPVHEVWFLQGVDDLPPSGIKTVHDQIIRALVNVTRLEVREVTLAELEQVTPAHSIALVSHLDVLLGRKLFELEPRGTRLPELARAVSELRGRLAPLDLTHLSFIHSDPTLPTDRALEFRDRIDQMWSGRYGDLSSPSVVGDLETFVDRYICMGPRMYGRLQSQWTRLNAETLIEITGGMDLHTEDHRDVGPMLNVLPNSSNLRILFGSPTSPARDDVDRRGLDLFARAAGQVQKYFLKKRVELTFVVTAVEGASNVDPQELVQPFERYLTDLAAREFDGLTNFEVHAIAERPAWLTEQLDRADIFVLPSRDEPYGLVAAEALGRGLPVVVSQNSGLGQALLQFAADTFLPIDDFVCTHSVEDLRDAIVRVIENDRSRAFFRHVATQAYERLSWTNAAHGLLSPLELDPGAFAPVTHLSSAGRKLATRSHPEGVFGEGLEVVGAASPSHLFNVPVLPADVVETFTTNLGREVTLERAGGQIYVRKVVDEPDELERAERQWDFVRGVGHGELYPTVLDRQGTTMLIEYADGGSLDRCPSWTVAAPHALVGLERLLTTVMAGAATIQGHGIALTANAFLHAQLEGRCDRLTSALPASGVDAGAYADFVEVCRADVTSGLAGSSSSPVHLAVHGDLGLNNMVLSGGQVRFIDTRAEWVDDVPVWDAAMDLATFYVFTGLIQPVLSGTFGFGRTEALPASSDEVDDLIRRAVDSTGYAAFDAGWRERMAAAATIRLLGSVSVQLTTAHEMRIERAAAMKDLTERYIADAPLASGAGQSV